MTSKKLNLSIVFLAFLVCGLIFPAFRVGAVDSVSDTSKLIKIKANGQKSATSLKNTLTRYRTNINTYTKLTGDFENLKNAFLANITEADNAINAINEELQAATSVTDANTQLENLTNYKTTTLDAKIFYGLAGAKELNSLLGQKEDFTVALRNLKAIQTAFSSYFSKSQITGATTKISSVLTDLEAKETQPIAASLLEVATYQNFSAKTKGGISDSREQIANNADALKLLLNSYKKLRADINTLYLFASQNGGISTSNYNTFKNSAPDEAGKYDKYYAAYQAKVPDNCSRLTAKITKELTNLTGSYLTSLNQLTSLESTTKAGLESQRVSAKNSLQTLKTSLNCYSKDQTYQKNLDAESSANDIVSNFKTKLAQATKLNKLKATNQELYDFLGRANGLLPDLFKVRAYLTAENQDRLDAFGSRYNEAAALYQTDLAAATRALESLLIKAEPLAADSGQAAAQASASFQKLAKAFQKDWYLVIKDAAETGQLDQKTFEKDEKAAQQIADFESKRASYYGKAEEIIDKRKQAIDNNDNKINDSLDKLSSDLKNVLSTVYTDTLVASQTVIEGELSTRRQAINDTVDYSDLKALVKSLNDLNLVKIFLPAQEIFNNLLKYYKDYQGLYQAGQSLQNGANLSIANPYREAVDREIGALNASIAALKDNDLDNIQKIISTSFSVDNLASVTTDDIKDIKSQLQKAKGSIASINKDARKALSDLRQAVNKEADLAAADSAL